jgi:membrane associated rhomboid family serine protease
MRVEPMTVVREPTPRQPLLRSPAAVIWLILILLGAHAARVFVFPQSGPSWFYEYGFVPARYSPAYLESHGINPGNFIERAWPFVTYMFLHANFTHVVINCVWLLAFGPIVARRFGAVGFLVFFLLCGIAGAAVHLALNWGSDAPVIGASAGVSGLMGAGFRMIGANSAERRLEPILSPRILLWTAIWVVVNVVAGLTGLGAGRLEVVAWQAHLGGYAAGLLLAGLFDWFARTGSPGPPT